MIKSLSDISRTNQVKLIQPPDEIAERLFQYLFKIGKGIEVFSANDLDLSEYENSPLDFYQNRHRAIKREIKKRLSEHDSNLKYSDIQYFLSASNGKNYVFFLSPNRTNSSWKQLFCEQWGTSNRERIINLVFKVYILLDELLSDTINDSEKLVLMHSASLTSSKAALVVWGQSLFLNCNHYNVVTLALSRKKLLFLPDDPYKTLDGEDMGELLVYKEKKYYSSQKLDGRSKNSIKFIRFDKEDQNFEKFKKTQLYHYQNLMTKLEKFLDICGIAYEPLYFQADHYLENRFIKNIEAIESLEIINNSGTDLTEGDKQFLVNFLRYQGIPELSFYNSGKTISTYELEIESEEKTYWKIKEIIPWAEIKLDAGKNYLIFNKLLDEETGSMAYRQADGLWKPSSKIDNKEIVDFYSYLKRKNNYLTSGIFVSLQGWNVTEFKALGEVDSSLYPVLTYSEKNLDPSILQQDVQPFTKGQILNIQGSIYCYLTEQQDSEQIEEFCKKHEIKVFTEFEKILIEIGIKNWIKESLLGRNVALPINSQSFSEKRFFAIYVRRPKGQEAKAVAVEFLYSDARVFIKEVMRDVKEIEKRFPILKKRKNDQDQLVDDQQYFIDETDKIYISSYTSDQYTPILIGREDILQSLEDGTLEINRRKDNKLLPLVLCYNKDVQKVRDLICLDLKNEKFIQYYVPPAQSLRRDIKNGFRVYHLIGKTFSKEDVLTTELVKHPLTALHLSTLTQNVLKISENSQSSLLQKVAKVFIEN